MRISIFVFALVCIPVIWASEEAVFKAQWEAFKTTFKKTYPNQDVEDLRKNVFKNNLRTIRSHNFQADLGRYTYRLGVNEYADYSQEEMREYFTGYNFNSSKPVQGVTFLPPKNLELPKEVDWREEGYVTPVKNQGKCGSCWAFGVTGSLEGQHYKKTGDLVSLSEQNLVDCAGRYGPFGCGGGWPDDAFLYIRENGGIDTEKSYPYTGTDDICKFKKKNIGAKVKGWVDVPSRDEDMLQKAVATVGPITVCIDTDGGNFYLYKSGVYSADLCTQDYLDHVVLVVGYGTYKGKDYWLAKNSWGKSWGMEGYIMMSRNKDNQCGIATKASYPLV